MFFFIERAQDSLKDLKRAEDSERECNRERRLQLSLRGYFRVALGAKALVVLLMKY